MSKGIITNQYLSNIASAIRSKTGTSSTYTPSQMAQAITDLPSGGDLSPLIERTILSVSGNYNFVGSYAFTMCTSLQTVNFPACSFIGISAFAQCSSLQSINFSGCIGIFQGAFALCSSLQSINFPVCTTIGSYAFSRCSSLQSVSFPNCTLMYQNAFQNCTSLSQISFPVCTSIGAGAFSMCVSLQTASFPQCTYIATSAFANCSSLISLYLMNSSIVTLTNLNAFGATPLSAGGTGTIYVPASLLTSYKEASNWSTLSAKLSGV